MLAADKACLNFSQIKTISSSLDKLAPVRNWRVSCENELILGFLGILSDRCNFLSFGWNCSSLCHDLNPDTLILINDTLAITFGFFYEPVNVNCSPLGHLITSELQSFSRLHAPPQRTSPPKCRQHEAISFWGQIAPRVPW